MSGSPAPDDGRGQPAAPGNGLVPVTVRLRGDTVRQLRQAAAREGASLEAMAALWLEEHAELVRAAPAAGDTRRESPPSP